MDGVPQRLPVEQVAAIEQRANKASGERWTAEYGYAGNVRTLFLVRGQNFDGVLFGLSQDTAEMAQHEADTLFAAHAREDIPALLQDRRALLAENESLQAEVDRLRRLVPGSWSAAAPGEMEGG